VTWITAFVVTLGVEVPLFVVTLRAFCGVRVPSAVALAVAVNAVSHPLLWFVLLPPLATMTTPVASVLIGEVLVWMFEAGCCVALARRHRTAAIATALLANGASFLVGLLLQR